ncbi:MAG: hypothetical protein H0U76_09185 [Ktedonobacteraceae bacterium]|nr:hypothetical protein [Ktedonobacteraceae bacterium]MBA3913230.1 hypothetical protein [Terriglobales bacterium]
MTCAVFKLSIASSAIAGAILMGWAGWQDGRAVLQSSGVEATFPIIFATVVTIFCIFLLIGALQVL